VAIRVNTPTAVVARARPSNGPRRAIDLTTECTAGPSLMGWPARSSPPAGHRARCDSSAKHRVVAELRVAELRASARGARAGSNVS
jgi:hypothetical protein